MRRAEIQEFFQRRIPEGWFRGSPRIEHDDEEILCLGILPPDTTVDDFREATRADRVSIAGAAEDRFGRKVSWGAEVDGRTMLFTTVATPVMTRLPFAERAVLDTLISSGVARSRSEALAWCVKLVGRHQAEWLGDLRDALVGVERVRTEGPTLL
jgi:hypothetical protein